MVEEYDRITSSASLALAPSRIRLFLFFNKPETAASMGPLLADAKSETWFVDALNGSGLFPRNLSDSATVDCLVNLDDEHRHHDFEAQAEGVEGAEGESKQEKNNVPVEVLHHDVQATMPDSPIVENCSSFGSSFFPFNVQPAAYSALPPLPTAVAAVGNVATLNPAGGSSENLSRVLSDDEISDQGMPVTFRKPPLPLKPVQQKAGACGYNLPSPDSVASYCNNPKPPTTPPTPNIVAASAVYKDTLSHPPLYPTKAAGTSAVLAKPETAAGVYRTAVTSTPTFVPIPATQFQQQYVGYAPVQQLSQSIAVPAGANANYGFEYAMPHLNKSITLIRFKLPHCLLSTKP
ncbi:hypothetical protein GH714_039468 [Hevea brasiliensis]|uniref:Uncharacterized protein n=1 Tax=Hevea brasiliensis TaxID=3981 RepID=A0A6A6NKM1_HEVBR|nr:hypothetical protein GH714_039468 [Hevea brasiliensis]